jgi:NAD(P)-dependent dehydrogenase (short-subunit alcohol dehydrogenase family)
MDLGLTGKKVLVTGGTKGIGRAIAEIFVAEGAVVSLCARNAEDVAQAVTTLGHGTIGTALDVADTAAVQAWVERSAAELGGIDIVVPNVSALNINRDAAAWKAGFDVDIMGTVGVVDAAMPWLETSDAASIVIISSVSGRGRSTSPMAPTAPSRRPSFTMRRASPSTSRARASAPIRCRPAIPIFPAASGNRSSRACPSSSPRRWR